MIDYDFKRSDDENKAMKSLYEIVSCLRDPKDGCPWDKEQLPKDIIRSMQGEIYEYIDALNDGDKNHQSEELGDIFMNLFLLGKIHDQNGDFKLSDSINDACEKYIRRHPHVFSNAKVENTDDVLTQWNDIKKNVEKREDTGDFFKGLCKSEPELDRCYKLSKKAAKVGFDWPDEREVSKKVEEELQEVLEAESEEHKLEELGDLLFTAVQMCRINHVKPSDALSYANLKFTKRFNSLKALADQEGLALESLSPEKWEDLWAKVKKH